MSLITFAGPAVSDGMEDYSLSFAAPNPLPKVDLQAAKIGSKCKVDPCMGRRLPRDSVPSFKVNRGLTGFAEQNPGSSNCSRLLPDDVIAGEPLRCDRRLSQQQRLFHLPPLGKMFRIFSLLQS